MRKPNKVYIIAKAGINHNGSINNTLEMIFNIKIRLT
jgi:sialic acid synthase SpsE